MELPAQTVDNAKPTGTLQAVLLVFVPFASGFFLSYLFRSINAVIAPQLIAEIGLSAGDLGLLTAAYFLAFASFQLPLGILLDRFGPRRVQACLLLVAALGGILFAAGDNRVVLIAGRALIGLGFAGGLMASFKAATLWFPRERWPLVNGCFLAVGGLGATIATKPVEIVLGYTDWRSIFVALSLITVYVSFLIFLMVPHEPAHVTRLSLANQLRALRGIYSDRFFWRLAPITITTLATGLAIQGLWAGPWLRDVAGLDRGAVADHLFAIALGMIAGMVGSGILADLLGRLGVPVNRVMGGGIVAFMLAQAAIVFQVDPTGVWVWVIFGFLSNMAVLAWPQVSGHFPLHYAGAAITGLNFLMFSGAFAAQYGIGAIIDLWPTTPQGGYPDAAYASAFGTLLVIQVAAFLWFLVPAGITRGDR